MVRGIRGAVQAEVNAAEAILEATRLLLEQMTVKNGVVLSDIAAVHFSATPDLNAAFPARAARQLGWDSVPLFGHLEMEVPGAVPRCVRVLMLVNTAKAQDQINHIYLGETRRLREI